MRDVMDEVMKKYDRDSNKMIDYEEFNAIITDGDVDLLFSIY